MSDLRQLSLEERILLERKLLTIHKSERATSILDLINNGPAPLSFAQKSLWFLAQFEPNSSAYNEIALTRIRGRLDISALERSLDNLTARHDSLRICFREQDGEGIQIAEPLPPISLPVIGLCDIPAEAQMHTALQEVERIRNKSFDLTQAPLWRTLLVHLAEDDYILAHITHHIISDGWSSSIFWRELAHFYAAFATGQIPTPLPGLPISYRDFAIWQREQLQGLHLTQLLDYWQTRLADIQRLNLLTVSPRPLRIRDRGRIELFKIDQKLSRSLSSLARSTKSSLFMLLLSAFQILLHRYSGQDDIVVGVPVANRALPEFEGVYGLFVNTLAMRTDCSGDPRFDSLLSQVRQNVLNDLNHKDLPIEKVVEELHPSRVPNRNPMFDVFFAVQNMPKSERHLFGLQCQQLTGIEVLCKFDLSLVIDETDTELTGRLIYRTDLFDGSTIQRMAGHFQTLLHSIVNSPSQRVSNLPMLTEAEYHQIVYEWNDTAVDFGEPRTIHALFEQQVERTPDAIAVIFDEEQLTYRQLNSRANLLAHCLIKLGVGPDVLIGLCLERSLEMIIGLLGILKAGGAYVPLSPQLPLERLLFILEDANIQLLVTNQEAATSMETHLDEISLILIEQIIAQKQENPASSVTSENLAYLIYTSGSTGKPKGILIEHQGLCNLIISDIQTLQVESSDRVLHLIPFSFDAAAVVVFRALCSGASLYIASRSSISNPSTLIRLLQEQGITNLSLSASLLAKLPETNLPTLKVITSGAEVCPAELVARWRPKDGMRRFFNIYGPTETTIRATIAECFDGYQKPLIGRPIANMQTYILDSNLQPVPIGIIGELHIGGIGLARGYLNRPQLTEKSFIPSPFGEGMLYKTGDLARYLPDGNIDYLGRLDNQVKIRGCRIELGEIEAILSKHTQVQDTAVIAREDGYGDKLLVAYVVCSATEKELRTYLATKLPSHMLPSVYVQLETLPLLPNGKVDRQALPALDYTDMQSKFVAPRTEVEAAVVIIWREALHIDPDDSEHGRRIDVYDNFFELGGHSLKAVQVISRIRNTFQIELPLRHLFETPTVAGLAQTIETQLQGKDSDNIDEAFASLVTIQTTPQHTHGKRPFFLVPGGGGGEEEFLIYAQLIHFLGPDQPVYGFYARGLKDQRPFHTNVPQMAADYLNEMRLIQPQGPYLLGGECVGGKVAYEMACQLQMMGQETEKLILMNTPLSHVNGNSPNHFLRQGNSQLVRVQHHIHQLRSRSFGQRLGYLAEKFHVLQKRLLPLTRDQLHAEYRRRTRLNYTHLLRTYRPEQPYSGSITLLNSEDHHQQNLTMAWDDLALGGLEIYSVPGTRDSYIGEHVKATAAQLNTCLGHRGFRHE